MSLLKRNDILRKGIKLLKEENIDLEKENKNLSTENTDLKKQNKALITDYSGLVSTLGEVINLVEETVKLSKDLKMPRKVIEKRAEGNESSNNALRDWLEGPRNALEATLELCGRQNQIFEGLAFSEITNNFIQLDAIARKNFVAFYDFPNQKLHYNNRLTKLLEIESENHTSLHQLLGKIKNSRVALGNRKIPKSILKRKYLFQILKKGKELTGFEIQVQGKEEKFKKLYLTTRIINYVSRRGDIKHKKAFGILMLFDEHKRVSKEYVEAEQIVKGLGEKFKSIYKAFENNFSF